MQAGQTRVNRSRLSMQYSQGWSFIELGFSTSQLPLAEEGFKVVREVSNELAEASQHNALYVKTLATLAFEQAVYYRVLVPGAFSDDVIDYTQHEYAEAIETVRGLDDLPLPALREGLTEMIACGALARKRDGACFPFIASPREERSGDALVNHDYYLLKRRLNKKDRKVALDIKTNDDTIKGPRDPAVASLFVLSAVRECVKANYPAKKQELRLNETRIPEASKNQLLHYAAGLIAREATGGQLKTQEREILQCLTSRFLGMANLRKTRTSTTGGESTGRLTHSLGDQLRDRFNEN